MKTRSETFQIGARIPWEKAGDGYYVAPDEPHGCLCLEEGNLIDVFSPHRADFIAEK